MSGPACGEGAAQGVPALTEEQRRVARAMAGLGVSRRHIAMHLRIAEGRLNGSLGDELELAEVEANSKVAKALYAMATQGRNVAAAIFWMKARAGWREKHEVEAKVTAPQGPFVLCEPPMTREEWLARNAARRLGAPRETP